MSQNNTVLLNNYSDDAQIKRFMAEELAPRVFNDIPITTLNSGFFSLVSEYVSQITEQLGLTASFYFNESFITKAILPDSIYAEAAIFNIGYSFATPSSTNFLLELKIEDIRNNSVKNADTGLYEFILDKNTKFNLPEGYVYSLDYDILIQYKDIETSSIEATIPAWNVQYINKDEQNVCATNKNIYITYRVTETWLCLLIQANEYERETHIVTNNMVNGVPNEDTVIMCNNHIAGFDITYTDASGKNVIQLQRDHILTIHDSVKDQQPYVNYIMDNPQTIRFMWQLAGNKHFVPEPNSTFEITIYTCHGAAANSPSYTNEEQPKVISSSNRYSNNGNVMKAAFVLTGCLGGADIGTIETVRRETIEAYNTANVLSTDHDLDEWFKTFYFKNILYPYFFKRRDDPWGRIWSGYIALTDNDDYVYRTNTLHGEIPYEVLYNNDQNTISNNEIIIPPGWIWTYVNDTRDDKNLYTVTPYTKGDGKTVETVNSLVAIQDKFVFANPFGIRIQKQPFAIGYFSPWVNENVTASKTSRSNINQLIDKGFEDSSYIYHAAVLMTNIKRTYKDDHYTFTSYINPTVPGMSNGDSLVEYTRVNAIAPTFPNAMWNYFNKPLDEFANEIPMVSKAYDKGYIPFDPSKTFLCVKTKNRLNEDIWKLEDMYIVDETGGNTKTVNLQITADQMFLYGKNDIWGTASDKYAVYYSGETEINLTQSTAGDFPITFNRIKTQNYYELRLADTARIGSISKIVVEKASETDLTKYGESHLVKIGQSYAATTYINVYFDEEDKDGNVVTRQVVYGIQNAANIYMPYDWNPDSTMGSYEFDFSNVGSSGIILYADMKPSPETGSVDYYKIPFNAIGANVPLFYVHSEQLPLYRNNFRVLMHTIVNGSETGRVEMQPLSLEDDGSYKFEATMYPLTEMIDIDNRINIASENNGGGSWKAIGSDVVSIDAGDPQIKISILVRSDDRTRDSEIELGDEYTGYRIIDEYMLDDVDLVQELKEMRSVVHFGESSIPTKEQIDLYHDMLSIVNYNSGNPYNLYYLKDYSNSMRKQEQPSGYDDLSFDKVKETCSNMIKVIKDYMVRFNMIVKKSDLDYFVYLNEILEAMTTIVSIKNVSEEQWEIMYRTISDYNQAVNAAFEGTNVTGSGMTVQLMPFVEYNLMKSDRFENFVTSFTQVHKAIEPVIFKRLEGNNYLDCKLIATYGRPHSYCADIYQDEPNGDDRFWPDLNVQIEFDVCLKNQALATNTINELRLIVKSYFNRLTSVHTPVEAISMDNNIYISNVIQQMEEHDNVAWLKFKGWYTNEKGSPTGHYMDANTQAIVQKWRKLEDMPKAELERYTPEMFVMDEDNIVINIMK